jgi:hypothetical protein
MLKDSVIVEICAVEGFVIGEVSAVRYLETIFIVKG